MLKPYQLARVILPERRQREQTATVLWVPLTTALTFLMLGFQLLLVFLLEWETLQPNVTPFPQTSHFAITKHLPKWIWDCRAIFAQHDYYTTYFYILQVFLLFFSICSIFNFAQSFFHYTALLASLYCFVFMRSLFCAQIHIVSPECTQCALPSTSRQMSWSVGLYTLWPSAL